MGTYPRLLVFRHCKALYPEGVPLFSWVSLPLTPTLVMTNQETLTVITTPVSALRIGSRVTAVESDSWAIQEKLAYLGRARRCNYMHKLVGTVCVAVTIPRKRCTEPGYYFGRSILDNDTARERLARAVARERARQAA